MTQLSEESLCEHLFQLDSGTSSLCDSTYWSLPDIIVCRLTLCRKIGDIMNVLERRLLHKGLICTVLHTLPSFVFIQLYYNIIETQRLQTVLELCTFRSPQNCKSCLNVVLLQNWSNFKGRKMKEFFFFNHSWDGMMSSSAICLFNVINKRNVQILWLWLNELQHPLGVHMVVLWWSWSSDMFE